MSLELGAIYSMREAAAQSRDVKTCTKCGEEKMLSEFSKKNKRGQRQSYCKKCKHEKLKNRASDDSTLFASLRAKSRRNYDLARQDNLVVEKHREASRAYRRKKSDDRHFDAFMASLEAQEQRESGQ